MWIRRHEVSQELGSIELTPHLRPAEEESLLRSKAVDDRLWMRRQRALHRGVCDRQSAEIADVLTERQLALHVGGGVDHRVRVELLDDLLGLGVVAICVFLAP